MNSQFILLFILISLLVFSPVSHAQKHVTIGIVTDGPIEYASWSPELFKNELLVLTRDDFDIRFPKDKQLDGGWSAERILTAVKKLQEDPDVDMVIALGYVSSVIAAMKTSLKKPTFAPFIMDASFQGLPRDGNASGVKHLNYLSSGANFTADLQVMKRVANCSSIAVFLDETDYNAQPGLIRRAREVTENAGVKLEFVLQHTRDENLAKKISADVNCVVMTGQGRLSPDAMKQVIATLIEKKVPSYSLLDAGLVEQGLLMAEAPLNNWRQLARRNALNMHAVLHGELAEQQPISFKTKRRLIINMETARSIGLAPPFNVLSDAILLNEQALERGRTLTLEKVARESVAANLDLNAAALGLEVGQSTVDQARSGLWPQLQGRINYIQRNDDNLLVRNGALAEQAGTASLVLNQLIYSDSILANVEIQRYLQNNREALKRQLELDIVQEAVTTYLNLLKAQTLIQIRREDLSLIRANLEVARDRFQAGVATAAEVYRWESQLATSRGLLLEAQAQFDQTRDAVNRILHRPLDEAFNAVPATLDDPGLIVSRKELFEYVNNDRAFKLMGEFLIKEGMEAAPELKALEASMSATQRELQANRRSYWAPTVAFQGELTHVVEEQRPVGLSAEGDTDWTVGINISLPLYEGGARSARVSGSHTTFSQLLTQRDAAIERIKQRIRSSLHNITATYSSIQLSKDAAEAAKKNLDLVIEAYARGAVTIIELIDAQNAALVAEENATNAVFNFLLDLMNLQRAIGSFDFFSSKLEMDAWLERLRRYVRTKEKM